MPMTRRTLQESIAEQRDILGKMLCDPLKHAAQVCAAVWGDRNKLDESLEQILQNLPFCKFLYALDTNAIQISDNVSHDGILQEDFGRDRSNRPYMSEVVPSTDFVLSGAYISLRAKRPSLTAIQIVRNSQGQALGFVGADFDLRNLPVTRNLYDEPRQWQQMRGDPSIRGTVFYQSRTNSKMDQHIETVLGVTEELMIDHGVFHAKLHFSSNRAVIWLYDDPYRYRMLDINALIDPNICLAYPSRDYPDNAVISADKIRPILDGLRQLRYMDETLYLRSGSLNIFNGILNLTFSCDGSHYIPYDEFLNKEHAFWGTSAGPGESSHA